METLILKLKTQLIKHEGLMLKPYKCTAGALTIGVGRNLDAKGISKAEATYLLENDIKDCIKQVKTHLSDIFYRLSENRQMVLVNMCFNLGINGLLQFKKTIALIRACEFEKASQEMLNSKWAKQVGNRAKELSNLMRIG
ncbi:MAG: glycoside hydrolase family protein [Candidatus Cloacimonadales bacterium]|jgi:lysozyme|nr:glycoside hydrolase family protein [Candidatus Cloacimonadota bacterium]MDX9976770.1 glycoside hydrolase family protein [Candidatus Cloacimonadales bacterium]